MKKYLILFLLISIFTAKSAYAGVLSCSITTGACAFPAVVIYRMSSSSNAHAELPNQSAVYYNNNNNGNSRVVCCTGVSGLSNACTGVTTPPSSAIVLKLSGATNAHTEENTNSNYTGNNACMSVPVGSSITVGYVNGTAGVDGTANCTGAGYDTILGSISSSTNSHVGGLADYARKICATASNPPVSGTLTSSVFDTGIVFGGSVGYNSIMWKGILGGPLNDKGHVRFRFAAEASANGDSNSIWRYFGITCNSNPDVWFDTTGPDMPYELPNCGWNNHQFFRYKVQICSNNNSDCTGVGIYPSPIVNDVIVNWSP